MLRVLRGPGGAGQPAKRDDLAAFQVRDQRVLSALSVVRKRLDAMLLVRAPLSRRLAFVLYFILSAFTLTRMTDMPYKWLGLFMGMEYTAALFAATLITASLAFGTVGFPFAVPVPASRQSR